MKATPTAMSAFATRIDLPAEHRHALIELLNQRLADTADLYSQIKQAHWNVKGLHFFSLHELFDNLAEDLFPFVDMIAERATALGGLALGTLRMAAHSSTLPEYPLAAIDGQAHLQALIERYAAYSATIRRAIDEADERHDRSTADLFTEVSRIADKHLWFLESHVQA